MKTRDVLAVFNRGRISRLALARTDVSRVAMSAEIQKNWMPRTLGPMSLRPGLGYLGANVDDGAYLPFIYDNDDTAVIELSPGVMRIWDEGTALISRNSVSSSVTNGTFDSNITGWTDASDSGAATSWVSAQGAGTLRLVGTGYGAARSRQQISVSGGDASTEHALRIVIERGPVLLRIGSSAGDDDIFRQAALRTGTHSISFTPGGAFWIEFSSPLLYPVRVDSVAVESSGVMQIPTPWADAATCKQVRWSQSGDVVYCACDGVQQYRIERRPNNSWSVVKYEPTTGPFLTENVEPIRLTPDDISGFINITSSSAYFQSGHVGSIFRLSSIGQTVASSLLAEDTYTDPIRVTGVTDGRIFNVVISGTFTATVSLQRSVGEVGSWVTVATYTSATTTTYDDGLDNSEVYYRLGIESGNYTSGTAESSLTYDVGSITGVVRIADYNSSTDVDAIVLDALGGTDATEVWAEGAWSDAQGWPQAVAIGDDGRLWWSGSGRNWGSVPDAFDVFDPDVEGDSAPINRGIGSGASNTTNWLLPMSHVIAGTTNGEYSIRSTSFDEPITPSNYNTKAYSTKGSAKVPAASVDDRGYFVGRNQRSIYELNFDPQSYRYLAKEMTLLCPEIGDGEFVRIAVQIEPDVRLHCVRGDGTAAVLVVDAAEDVLCWVDVETDGLIEDVVVLPGAEEDKVFYRVRRTINGTAVRHHEKWAMQSNTIGGTSNYLADSYITGTGAVSGLSHLEGKTVVIWGDGEDQGTGVVTSGAVSGHSYSNWVVGLGYSATYKSAKLAGQTQLGLSITQHKRINSISLVLDKTHHQGLEYGPSFDVMDPLPETEGGRVVDTGEIYDQYDQEFIEFPGEWETDSRLCLRATAPRPCTVLAAVLNVDVQDGD